jgi:hypothetical protein
MRYAFNTLVFFMIGLVTLTAGCGGGSGTLPVTGKLLWDDGSPIAGVNVQFVPEPNSGGRNAIGVTGSNGDFQLTTFTYNDGALPGDYIVVLVKFESDGTDAPATGGGSMTPEDMAKKMKEHNEKQLEKPTGKGQFPPSYGNPKTSPIKWKFDSTHNKPEFKIPKP